VTFTKRLVRRLNRITQARPGLGLRLAALAGFCLGPRLGEPYWISGAELEELLGEIEPRALRRLQRRIAARELRNRAAMYLTKHAGAAPLAQLIRLRGAREFARLREQGPVAVIFWHIGAVRAVEVGLHSAGIPIFVAWDRRPGGRPPDYRWRLVTDQVSGFHFLLEAIKDAQHGFVPTLAMDGPGHGGGQAPFFGRSVPVPSGAGALAVRARARLVPATSRWVGFSPRIELTLHDPIPEPERGSLAPDAWEKEVVNGAVRWFEGYVRGHAEDLRPVSVRNALARLRGHRRAPSEVDFARLAEEFQSADAG
jgi:lauroyl/myristoyl acyltransferase